MPDKLDHLRQQAEQKLQLKSEDYSAQDIDDVKRLLHELDVHQIELELQHDELLKAQEQLTASNKAFSLLFNNAPYGYLLISTQGKILQYNSTLTTWVKTPRFLQRGRHISGLLDKQAKDDFIYNLSLLLKSRGRYQFDCLWSSTPVDLQEEEYEELWLNVSGSEFDAADLGETAEGEKLILLAFKDISDAKKNEQTLKQYRNYLEDLIEQRTRDLKASELKYRLISDYTYDWESWIDKDGKWIYCSPACERVSGYPAQYFLEQPDAFINLVHPKNKDVVLRHIRHDIEDDFVHKHNFKITHKNGQDVYIEHICQPVYDEQGNFNGRRASNRDITRKVQIEKELVNAKIKAEEANVAKSQFLSNMSHEIRTPIHAIVGMTSLLKRAKLDNTQQRRLTQIEDSTRHLMAIINDILDISKIEAGKMTLSHYNFSLLEVSSYILNTAHSLTAKIGKSVKPY